MNGLKTMVIIIMTIFMLLQGWLFGKSDAWSLILMIFAIFIMYHAVITLHRGNRKALRAHARKHSWLYNLLSDENTPLLHLISFVSSIVLSILMVVTLKGIILNLNIIFLGFIMVISSFAIHHLLHLHDVESQIVNKNLQQDIANHANTLLQLFVISAMLTLIFALFFSLRDTAEIINSKVSIGSFVQVAADTSLEKTDGNRYTRLLVNLHILLDHFKLAASHLIVSTIFSNPEKHFFTLYGFVFILNFIKLLGFSFSVVLMQRGLELIAMKVQLHTNHKQPALAEQKTQGEQHENE